MINKKSRFNIIAPFYDLMMKLFLLLAGGEIRFREKILKLASLKDNHIILDAGCGTGTFSILASKKLTKGMSIGLDLSPKMISIATKKGKNLSSSFILSNSSKMPFRSNCFDRVFLTYVLHELPPFIRQQTLGEVRRILKPDGLLIATDLHIPKSGIKKLFFMSIMALEEEHAWDFVTQGLESSLESAGFRINKKEFVIESLVLATIASPIK